MSGRVALPWTVTIMVATCVDVAMRLALSFDMTRIRIMEAVLFPTAGVVLLWFLLRGARQHGWRRGVQVWTVAGCFLAGLRVGLWALGVPVSRANLAIIVIPLLVLVVRSLLRTRAGPTTTP